MSPQTQFSNQNAKPPRQRLPGGGLEKESPAKGSERKS